MICPKTTSPTPRLLELLGSPKGVPLAIGKIPASELADQYGTPLFVFDASALRLRIRKVRAALGARVNVLFAVKANPNLAVAAILRSEGAGAEVASAGEALLCRAAGFEPEQLQFAGPGKCDTDLRCEVGVVNIESESEYAALAALAEGRDTKPKVAVRVNFAEGVRGAKVRMGGGCSQFGVDEERVAALVQRIREEGKCEFSGLHTYMGTQCSDASAWVAVAKKLLAYANDLEARTGCKVSTLNFGGGFSVPYFENDVEFDLEECGAKMRELIQADGRDDRAYFVELGRYLTAEAGVFLTRVLHTKTSGGKNFATVDGGCNQHAAASGLTSIIRRPFPIVHADSPWPMEESRNEPISLGGPLCTPVDEFCSGLPLPRIRCGDLVAILASGAYGLTFSLTSFLGHPTAAEVLVEDGSALVVRDRGRIEDILHGQHLPNGERSCQPKA